LDGLFFSGFKNLSGLGRLIFFWVQKLVGAWTAYFFLGSKNEYSYTEKFNK
jgi:hypothetical protein